MKFAFVALALITLIASSLSDRPRDLSVQATVSQTPALKNAVAKGRPVKIDLKEILDANKEYAVWIETSDGARALGKVNPADAKMVFVRIKEEKEFQPFCGNCRAVDDSIKLQPIPEHDLEEE